eukprot:2273233-Pleurochrysis_carterae.AAC.1
MMTTGKSAHLVCAPHDQPVLGRIELVLVLDDKTLAGLVVGLALPPPAVLHEEALVVGGGLQHLHDRSDITSCLNLSSFNVVLLFSHPLTTTKVQVEGRPWLARRHGERARAVLHCPAHRRRPMSLKHVFGPYLRLADRVSLLRVCHRHLRFKLVRRNGASVGELVVESNVSSAALCASCLTVLRAAPGFRPRCPQLYACPLVERIALLVRTVTPQPTPLGIFLDEEGLKALASYCTVVAFTAGTSAWSDFISCDHVHAVARLAVRAVAVLSWRPVASRP